MSKKRVQVGMGVFVFKDGRFFVQLRKGAHGANTWAPPGGHIEFGESFEETARREVKEETGMQIKNIRFGAVTNDYFKDEEKHYVTVWVLTDWKSGVAKNLEPHKCIEAKWLTFDELPENLFLPLKQLLKSEFMEQIRQAI